MSLSPGGILPRDMNARQYSEWARAQQAMPQQDAKTFSPTWAGFSSAPSVALKYIDLGTHVIIWTDAAVTGTSNATTMSFSGLPSAITPSGQRNVMFDGVLDNGAVNHYMASAQVEADGEIHFSILSTFGGTLILTDSTAFTAANVKGLAIGTSFMYPK